MYKLKRFLFAANLLLVFLLVAQAASAQIVVNVSVLPPASPVAKNYIEQGNNVKITIINNFSLPQQVKIIPSINGISNGVKIAVNENFNPAIPLTLAGGQTKTFTLNQLKINNGNLTPNDIQLQGIDLNSYLGGSKLPEGLYTFCVKVITSGSAAGGPGQSFQGCGTVNILSYLPPIITSPVNNASIKPLQPQFITFSWTPSGVVGKTRYRFRLVDLTAAQLFDPNDAFVNENILPFYQQQNIVSTSLQLDNSKPKLKEGNRYALQITAYDPQNNLNFKNAGHSKITVFTYKNELPLATPPNPKKDLPVSNDPQAKNEDDAPSGDCNASSKYAGALKQSNKNGIANGTDILVGKFVMKNTAFTQTNGSYSGTGEILVNFTGAKIKVKFSGVNIGDDNRVYKGAITGMYDVNSGITDAMAASKTEVIKALPNASALMKKLDEAARKINTKDLPLPIDLPLSFDKGGFKIGIVGIIFEPTEAYLNAVLNTDIPQVFGNEFLLLSAKAVPIHPNGFGTGASLKLALAETQSLAISKNKLYLQLLGGADKTFATFDCTGFKELTLNGAVVLDRNIALPIGADFKVITDANVKVKAAFSVSAMKNFDDFLINSLSLSHAFALPVASDIVFKADSVALDFSSLKKIAGIGNNIANDWTGLFIKSMKLNLPAVFKKDDNANMSFAVENMFISKMGISGSFAVTGNPLVSGSVLNWNVLIKEFGLIVKDNKLTGGSLKGSLTLPLGDKANVGFEGKIAQGTDGADMSFTVITEEEIDANLFLAKMKFFPNSSITFAKISGKYEVAAKLNGEVGIDFASNPGGGNVNKFNLPNIAFQELTLKGKEGSSIPEFDLKFVALQNQKGLQAKIANFELNLNDLQFKKPDATHAGLSLNLGLSLFGGEGGTSNGAGASTAFTIWAKHTGKTFSYEKATLDAIAIKADLGVAKLEGSINIYAEDPTYGNGFRGAVSATINAIGVKVDVALQFGRTLQNKGDFKYWYFDAMADFGKVGINIPGTAASIYGFGGGAYCNMTRNAPQQPITPGKYAKVASQTEGAPTTSGVVMTPKKETAGFRAAVLFGITGSRNAFNGDVTFSMELNSQTLGVTKVELDGNAYLMQDPIDLSKRSPDKAFLYCHANIKYDAAVRTLSGNFAATLNIVNIVQGGGDISFKFTTPAKDKFGDILPGQSGLKWYIKVGQWTPNKDPFADNARLHAEIGFDVKVMTVAIELQGYFMVGNDLPSGLPPLPDKIYAVTKSLGAPIKTGLPASVSSTQGLAFAFGAGVKVSAHLGGKIFSADAEAAAGFDVLLSDLNATCNGTPMGIDGWYAQGQAYAYIDAEVKFAGLTLLGVTAGAVLQVKLPNPTWVRGDVYFSVTVLGVTSKHKKNIEKGTLCGSMKTDLNPFETAKLIQSVITGPNEKKVNPLSPDLQVNFTYADGGTPIKIFNAYTELYDYYYAQNQVFLLDKDKKVIDKIIIKKDGKNFKIEPTMTLMPNTEYYVRAKSNIYDEIKEEVTVKFTTGSAPSKFSMSDVYDSYPLPNQRYFMKQNANGDKVLGYLKFNQDLSYLFNNGKKIYVLILDAKEQLVYSEAVSGNSQNEYGFKTSSVYFTIPGTLKNSTIYQIKVLAPDGKSAFGEVIFDGFYFKTSKFNNVEDKMNSFKVIKVGAVKKSLNVVSGNELINNVYITPLLMIKGEEGIDGYEMYGFKKTMNNQEDIYGRLLEVDDANNDEVNEANWKYKSFLSKSGVRIPQVTEDERYYMIKLIQAANPTWEIPGGRNDISWMKDLKSYEAFLHSKGILKNNEVLTGADNKLSADDINGGGIMNNNMGLGNGPVTAKYYGLVNNIHYNIAYDYMKLADAYLKAAAAKSGTDLVKTWNILKKIGAPKANYEGQQTLRINVKRKASQGAIYRGNYNYNVPVVK